MPADSSAPTSVKKGWRRFPATETSVGGVLFVPPGRKRLPLVVALHGCNQNAADFAMGAGFAELAEQEGFAVLFPETTRTRESVEFNPFGCWIWWAKENQARGGQTAQVIELIDRAKEASSRLSAGRVYVAGFSSGAAMAAILGCVYPDYVAAFASHAGVAFAAAEAATPTEAGLLVAELEGKPVNKKAFTPLNLGKIKAWSKGAMSAMKEAEAAGEHKAMKALEARGEAEGEVPALIVHGDRDDVVDRTNAKVLLYQVLRIADIVDTGANDQSVNKRANSKTEKTGGSGDYKMTTWEYHDSKDRLVARRIKIGRLGHAWSGGSPAGTYTDPEGPNATQLTWDFFKAMLERE